MSTSQTAPDIMREGEKKREREMGGGASRVSSVKWRQKKEKDDVKDCEREEREQRSEGERMKEKAGSQLNWRGREGGREGRKMDRERR